MSKKHLTEQEVRTQFITPAIQKAGWAAKQIREDYAITAGRIIARGGVYSRAKAKRADYVLFYKAHIPLAVVEAKDSKHSVSDGMQQALDYAERLQVPFVFTSNGDGFTFHNRLAANTATEGDKEAFIPLDAFPSPDHLWALQRQNAPLTDTQERIISEPYFTQREDRTPRYYQRNAINMTVEAIAREQNRILLVMATGTGKTYTAFQIIWRLWKAGVKKRILFLADRNALIDQTYVNDFSPFKDKMTIVRHRKVDKSYEIYLALYQGLTGDDDKDIFRQFSPQFFDLIVIDECHRGSAREDSQWREILKYFSSATHLGLTATPKETSDVSNIDYFGEPIYTYSLKEGIDDGFLAPYRVIRVLLDKDAEGFRPTHGQCDKYGHLIEDREYGITDFDRNMVLEKRTRMVAKVVSNYLKKHKIRYDKAIFFCVDTDHADRMRQALVNENADLVQENTHYVMRITGDDAEGKKQIDAFRDVSSRYPTLVTTSKLLTTGVDVQMVKLIVLDANIGSMTEFKQIIGRGTRVREDMGKMFFTIFDFRNATRLFADPDFDGPPTQDDTFTPTPEGDLPDDDMPEIPDGEMPDDTNSTDNANDDTNDDNDDGDGDSPEPPRKYYVESVEVSVLKERIQYLDKNGKLITESLTDYTRRNVRNQFATLQDFLNAWQKAEKKQAIIDAFAEQGILLEELQVQVGKDFDPFDLVCHIAFDQPPLTRKERANNVKKRNYFAKYGEKAQAVLQALLDKYADSGITSLQDGDILKVSPLTDFGNVNFIVNRIFKGKDDFEKALRDLENALYVA